MFSKPKKRKSISFNPMEVTNNKKNLQFEIRLNDELAFMGYRMQEDNMHIMHTEVPESMRGEGIAKELAEYAIQYAQDKELKLVAYCPFMRTYLKRRK